MANGVVREATYGKSLRESSANRVSVLTAIPAFAAYFWFLQRRWPIPGATDAFTIGAAWVVLTVGFEFGFGRVVANQSWDDLLRDYDLAAGHTWPLVLAWIGAGPEVTRRLQAGRWSR